MTKRIVVVIVGALILLWPILPPLLATCNLHDLADIVSAPWALTCHRLPDRTMHFLGYAMPMCSRCAGLDVGFALGLIIAAPYRGPKFMWSWVAGALALLLVEMITQNERLHPIWHATRFATGALLTYPIGVALAAIVIRSAPDA